jgi:hypothetical protein
MPFFSALNKSISGFEFCRTASYKNESFKKGSVFFTSPQQPPHAEDAARSKAVKAITAQYFQYLHCPQSKIQQPQTGLPQPQTQLLQPHTRLHEPHAQLLRPNARLL